MASDIFAFDISCCTDSIAAVPVKFRTLLCNEHVVHIGAARKWTSL